MANRRRQMGGLLDWFKKKPQTERALSVPSEKAPTPSIFDAFRPSLPAQRREGGQLPAMPAPTKKPGGLLSIFEAFLPAPAPETSKLPAVPEERPTSAPTIWEQIFGVPGEEPEATMLPSAPAPLIPTSPVEIFTPVPAPREPKYTFIRLPRLQVGQWITPTPNELAEHFQRIFNTEQIIADLRNWRKSPEWASSITERAEAGMPVSIQVEPVVYQNFFTDFAKLYNIPWNVMESYLSGVTTDEQVAAAQQELLKDIIEPMNQRVGEAFEIFKPADLPGWFWVGYDEKSGSWWLHYLEAMLGPFRLPQAGGPGG